jgi:flagellin
MSVSLSQGMRNAVYSLGDVNSAIEMANKRLATGKKVNSAIDNAGAYFRAQGLQKDGRDMSALIDGMERGSKIISKAAKAIDGISKLLESAQALSRQAGQIDEVTGAVARNVLRDQIAGILTQANSLARDAGYEGKNVLTTGSTAATAETINTNVSGGTSVVLAAQDMQFVALDAGFTLANTGLTNTITASANTITGTTSWGLAAGTTLINQTITSMTNMLTSVQTRASALATQASVLDIRKSFTKDAVRANNEFADYLTLADINEEGANLTSLQTKQSLAVTSLSLAGRADQAILRLF